MTDEQKNLPYKWNDVMSKLFLTSNAELPKVILCSEFLDPWVNLRDEIPITPGTSLDLQPKDKDTMTQLIQQTYSAMDSLSTSKYDRPKDDKRRSWKPSEHLECMIYQAARNLACKDQPFSQPFSRPNLKTEAGRSKAQSRIRGLVMLVVNLAYTYTNLEPSIVVRQIETLCPTKDPARSPIKEIRIKHVLDHTDIGVLRRKVLDAERRGEEEKQWLIRTLMKKEGIELAGSEMVGVKQENGGQVGAKRAREGDETVVAASKRVKGN